MSELYYFRRALAGGALVFAGATALTACGGPENYEGTGNEYTVVGVVDDVEGDDTIHINQDQLDVITATGKAVNWFEDHQGQDFMSEDFNFDPDYNKEESGWFGACEHNVRVGVAYDVAGNEIDPSELQSGDTVEITGRIRESDITRSTGKSSYCGSQDKNVFDVVQVVAGE